MPEMQLPAGEEVFAKHGKVALFHQLGVKVDLMTVPVPRYFAWLDDMKGHLPHLVPGAEIAERPDARTAPVLNTGVYYDTDDYRVVETGSLIRTTCAVTHAFCAFKLRNDGKEVRKDHRYVFQGRERAIIQAAPASKGAVEIVLRLLARTDIEHPGTFLQRHHGIDPTMVRPAILVKRDAERLLYFEAGSQTPATVPLAEVATAINPRTGTVLSASERRNRILTTGRMIDDIIEWGWREAPARRPRSTISPIRPARRRRRPTSHRRTTPHPPPPRSTTSPRRIGSK